ncbi:MAG TPA: hypothetical protein VNK47_02650 [Candidatus Dormibacteraeota bacterium]|nr:hypothetical protein [Candidatus Dormibacteraeota bacterium]
MATNQTPSTWPLRKPQQLVYVELGPHNGGMVLGICELGFSFRAVAPVKPDGPINFAFAIDGKNRLQGVGEIAWTEDDRKTGGLRFTNVSPQFRESLCAWLADELTQKPSGREHTPAVALPLDSIQRTKSTMSEGITEPIKPSAPQAEEESVDRALEEVPLEPTPAVALPLDSIQETKSTMSEGMTEPIKPSAPQAEEEFVDSALEQTPPRPTPAAVPQVFQKPIVPSPPELTPLPAVKPQRARFSKLSSRSESTFALAGFRLPLASPAPPPAPEPAVILPPLSPPEPAPTLKAAHFPDEIPRAKRPPSDDAPPPAFVRGFPSGAVPAESPRLNRAAAAGIISLALAVILVALVLNFRREVGETLIGLGRQLAGEQQPPPTAQVQNPQSPSNPSASPVRNDTAPASASASNPSPSSSGQPLDSTAQSQPATSTTQAPGMTPQSKPDRASAIQQIEDIPAPEDGGSGQKEFDQAKTILKGIHRQRDIQMAVALLWTGVRKGYVPAEVTLADLYARGDGVQRSCEQARVLLKAAIRKGSPEGRRRFALLRQQGCAGS